MNEWACMYYSTLCLYNPRAGYSTEGGGGVKGVRSSIQYPVSATRCRDSVD